MNPNTQLAQDFLDAIAAADFPTLSPYLTEDARWFVPGIFDLHGSAAIVEELQEDAKAGSPTIQISNIIDAENAVIIQGHVRMPCQDGTTSNSLFCDIFQMENAKIKMLTTYLMQVEDVAASTSAN